MKRGVKWAAVAWICMASPAAAQVSGFLDSYYAWNGNRPADHANFIAGTGTTAARSNQFDINLAAVEFVREPRPVGLHLTLVAGSGTDVVHAADPARETFRYVYQASVQYKATHRLTLEGGIYPSHIGFEGFFSKDDWNYTRGWLGEFSPYYQTGIKASYVWNDRWSAQLHVLNGWQIIGENNEAKAVGTQVAYSAARFSATVNTFMGAELPNDNDHQRRFVDSIFTFKVNGRLTLAASADRGRQAFPGDQAANWLGLSLWSRYAVDDRRAVAARLERFRDPDDGISGARQTIGGATLTFELRPHKNLIVKVEARHDHSTAPVFDHTQNETLAVVSAVMTF